MSERKPSGEGKRERQAERERIGRENWLELLQEDRVTIKFQIIVEPDEPEEEVDN